MLATSAPAMMQGHIGNMLVTGPEGSKTAYLAEHRKADGPPNGMGDLAAALMLGNMLSGDTQQGDDLVKSLQKTTASLAEIMLLAARTGSDELPLEAALASIIRPRTPIVARRLLTKRKKN